MRIVLDTNVLISGVMFTAGTPSRLVDAWLDEERFELITSHEQLDEFKRVLNYEHLKPRIQSNQAERVLLGLEIAVLPVDLPSVTAAEDPDDNVIIATAIAGKANYLVSGDKRHMLSIGSAENILIISPSEMLAILDQKTEP